jgi:hypothetical protein
MIIELANGAGKALGALDAHGDGMVEHAGSRDLRCASIAGASREDECECGGDSRDARE